jgi:hypothetical protein
MRRQLYTLFPQGLAVKHVRRLLRLSTEEWDAGEEAVVVTPVAAAQPHIEPLCGSEATQARTKGGHFGSVKKRGPGEAVATGGEPASKVGLGA